VSRFALLGLLGVVAAASACTPLYRSELRPQPAAHDAIEARVVAQATDSTPQWYVAFELALHNPSSAPVDVDLAAARLQLTSLVELPPVLAAPYEGGAGAIPSNEPRVIPPPPHVVVAPGETRVAWIAFGRNAPPPDVVLRRETLTVPGAGEIIVNDVTAEHPHGTLRIRHPRAAFGILARIDVDRGSDRTTVSFPYEFGAVMFVRDMRLDLHFSSPFIDTAQGGVAFQLGALRSGAGWSWYPLAGIGIYTTVEYQASTHDDVVPADGLVLGAGVSLPLWFVRVATGWRVPIANLRFGWAGTIGTGGGESTSAGRIGLEFTVPMLLR
jgi:hypothetical protein